VLLFTALKRTTNIARTMSRNGMLVAVAFTGGHDHVCSRPMRICRVAAKRSCVRQPGRETQSNQALGDQHSIWNGLQQEETARAGRENGNFGQAFLFEPFAIALDPFGGHMSPNPLGSHFREDVQDIDHRLGHPQGPIQGADLGQHMRRVRSLTPSGLEPPALLAPFQKQV
jgi:hypothetical protein